MATGTKSLRDITQIMNEWELREKHGKREYGTTKGAAGFDVPLWASMGLFGHTEP